jgi:hypothetical protein
LTPEVEELVLHWMITKVPDDRRLKHKRFVRAARSCAAEADRADRLGQHRYAELVRASARTALAELDAITARAAPVDIESAKRQERTRAFAAVVLNGLH